MATTSPWGIPLHDASSPAQLDALLNSQANALNTALTTLQSGVSSSVGAGANSYKGTAAQRAAFTTATNGQLWQDTDGSMGLYRRQGGAWMRLVDGNATPFAMAAGTVSAISVNAGNAVDTSVSFPSGRFSVAPIVTVTQFGAGAARDIVLGVKSVTASGFVLMRGSAGSSRTGIGAQWTAIQMAPGQAAG